MSSHEVKIGDIVICINPVPVNNKKLPIYLNKEYKVFDINKCPCGCIKYNLGFGTGASNAYKCTLCNRTTTNESIWWLRASRFIKKDTRTLEEQLEEAISTENYELAAKLTKTMNNLQIV
jgi:UvrB/UvrC motif-containing protein